MTTTLTYCTTTSTSMEASTSSLSPPSTPPNSFRPLMPNLKRPYQTSTPTSNSSSGESTRPMGARKLFYSTSSLSLNNESIYSNITTSSTSSLLPAAIIVKSRFPPRTPVKKSSVLINSSMKRSPGTYNLNIFTMGAFAQEEAEAAAEESRRLKSNGVGGEGNLFDKSYFNYKKLNSSKSILVAGGEFQFNVTSSGNNSELSSPELPESPMSGYSSSDEDEEMGLDSGNESSSSHLNLTPSANAVRRAILKNCQQQVLKRTMTTSRSTLRSSFSSSSSIESLSPSLQPRL